MTTPTPELDQLIIRLTNDTRKLGHVLDGTTSERAIVTRMAHRSMVSALTKLMDARDLVQEAKVTGF